MAGSRKIAIAGANRGYWASLLICTLCVRLRNRATCDGASEAFRKKRVVVDRLFAPMNERLRASIGTPHEMDRFMVAFKTEHGRHEDGIDVEFLNAV